MPLTEAQLGQLLASDAYLRERLRPRLRDFNHLSFADLLRVVEPFAKSLPAGAAVFDYGCGGAPYEPSSATAAVTCAPTSCQARACKCSCPPTA